MPPKFLSILKLRMSLYGNRIFADIIQLKWGHTRLDPNPIMGLFWKTDTHSGKTAMEMDRDQSYAVTNQGMARIVGNQLKLARGKDGSSLRDFRKGMALPTP